MSTPVLRASFSTLLLPIVRKVHDDKMKQLDPLTPKLFEVNPSDRAYEIMLVTMGMSTLQEKGENEDLRYDTDRQMYSPQFQHITYALGKKISMEALQDTTGISHAKRVGQQLAKATQLTNDILSANIINNAYTSGKVMTSGDGAILCSASHPSPVGNQSNTITVNADFSEASLEAIITQIRKATDERGNRIGLTPQKLVIPVDLEFEVERVLGNSDRPGTTDRDINAIVKKGLIPGGVIMSPYFSDTDQFLVLTDADDGLIAFNRFESPVETDREFDTKAACFSKVIRTSRGWVEWRCVYGSPGA